MSKFVRYIVIGIVVISFAFFGIYSAITSQKGFVAKIDGEKITTAKFNSYLSERRQNILSNRNDKATIALVSSKQFERLMLNEIINSIIIHKFLQDNGIKIDEKISAAYIKTMQAFNKEGKFDSEYFKKYLEYTNTKEKDFLKSYIPKIEETIFTAITNGVKFSMDNIAEEYLKSQKKERNFDILLLKNTKPTEYKEEELASYYETVKHNFTQEAKHIVTVSYLNDYINQNVQIFHSTPQNIAQYYNEEYMGKTMKLQYTIFKDKQTAQTAHSIVKKQGISLQNITDTMLSKNPKDIISQGTLDSSSIESNEILTEIKNLSKNGITPIIETKKGYYIAQILEIKETKFSAIDAKNNINKEILKKRKCNNIQIFTDRISEDLQSGLSFEAASLKYGFPISKTIIIDAQTKQARNANTNLPEKINQKLLEHILANEDISYSHVLNIDEKNCSFVIYKQQNIEPKRTLSLSEVRGKIVAMYQKQKTIIELQKEAKTIERRVKSLKNTLESYKDFGTFVNTNLGVNNAISPEIFSKKIGETFAITGKNGNVYVITVKSEKPYTGTLNKNELSQAKTQIETIYYNTYLQAWLNMMHEKYTVQVYI